MTRLPLLCLSVSISFLAISTSQVIEDITIDKCEKGSWAVSDVTLQPEGQNVIITADVGQGQASNGTLRQIRITLTGCDMFLRCSSFANRSVSDVDCESDHISDVDQNACDLAQAMGEWEVKTGNFSTQQGNDDPIDLCFYYGEEDVIFDIS